MFTFGAKRLKIDFHLHTEKDREFKYDGNDFSSDYVEKLKKEEICIGVITNHNKFNKHEFKMLKKKSRKEQIFLMPGVELSVKEGQNGLHTLIVFNEDEWLKNGNDDINTFLDQVFVGIENRETKNTRCNNDLINTIRILNGYNKDYFIILAHIEQDRGFIKELGGGMIETLSRTSEFQNYVYGFQKLRTRDNIKKLRSWMGFELPFVEGSDPKSIEDIGKGESCYIKLGIYSFDAVKLALKDYTKRISSDINDVNHSFIKSIKVSGGKLDEKIIKLSDELNTLVGIRGSGKSSVLEILRYGLDLDADTDKKYKNELVNYILESGGIVEIEIVDKFNKVYKIRRILNEQPIIIDDSGIEVNISINTILNNPLYFGQKDLALTEDGYEIKLLNKLLGNKLDNIHEQITKRGIELGNVIDKWTGLDNISSKIKDLESENSNLMHKIKIFEDRGIAIKLNKQVTYGKDKIQIEKIELDLKNILDLILSNVNENIISDIEEVKGYESTYNKDLFIKINKKIDEFASILNWILEKSKEADAIVNDIFNIKDDLINDTKNLKEEFAEIKREIDEPNLNLEDYVKFSEQIKHNEIQINEYIKLELESNEYIKSIKRLICEINVLLNEEYSIYKDEIHRINSSQDQLKVEIIFKGNKEGFKSSLKDVFTGSGITDTKYQYISRVFPDFMRLFTDVYFMNGARIKKIITESEFDLFKSKFTQNLRDIMQLRVTNKILISYHGKPLNKHSLGQRASALVLFILTQEDNDLIIIDQPEDDLDNQVIYKELINSIKEKKQKIQFLFATHNANIPVLGDAEQIIVTNYNDEDINIELGSIDVPIMQSKIVDIMEGGPEAFEKRNCIYKLWRVDNC